jgi:hypothetical protein
MCVIIQNGTNSLIAFLNWYSSPFNFTYNRTISVPFNKPYGLAKLNDDTMIYVSGNLSIIYYNIYLVCSVYDRLYENELASWNMSISYPTLYDMILICDYELYLIDYSMSQLIHYGSSLQEQCTINE